MSVQVLNRVVMFSALVRKKPVYVFGKRYDRYLAVVPGRSEAERILNELDGKVERKLKDVRLIESNRVFYIPSLTINVEMVKKDGTKRFRVNIPIDVGKQVEYKEVVIIGYLGEGDGTVKIVDSKTYNTVVIFEALVRDNGSIAVTIPAKYTELFTVGQTVSVDVIDINNKIKTVEGWVYIDKIKTVEGWVYSGGTTKDGRQMLLIKFRREDMRDYLDREVPLIVKY